jgi:16S rRNA processing protein RimM
LKSSNSPIASGELLEIGKVVGAQGIAGAIKIYTYAESPDCFNPGRTLTLVDRDGHPHGYQITWAQAHKKAMRVALEGVNTRDAAEAMTGWPVFMAKSDLPPLEPDTYYWSDVIGMAVYTVAGDYLGEIEQIIPTGANDVYVVKTPADHPAGEILIPAIASVIIEIDVDQRRMRVELPEGLI